jgi:hypothetical protein
VWKNGFWHGGQNKVAIKVAYIPHGKVSEFLEGNEGTCKPQLNGKNIKTWPYKKRSRSQ